MNIMPKWLAVLILIIMMLGCGDGNSNSGETLVDNGDVEPLAYTFDTGTYLQLRSFENPHENDYLAWLPITHNDLPIHRTDVVGFRVLDSSDMIVPVVSTEYKTSNMVVFDCVPGSSSSCIGTTIERNGYFASFITLPPDIYTIEVDILDGSTLAQNFAISEAYPLPIVDESTMQAQRYDGTLEFRWKLPADAPNWNQVDQVALVFYNQSENPVFILRGNEQLSSVDVPEGLIAFCAGIGDGTVTHWQIQTLTFDENNVNCATGYSELQPMPSEETMPEAEDFDYEHHNQDGEVDVNW